jgi:hypothetical protein
MKRYLYILLLLIFFACDKEDGSVRDDRFMNFKVMTPDVTLSTKAELTGDMLVDDTKDNLYVYAEQSDGTTSYPIVSMPGAELVYDSQVRVWNPVKYEYDYINGSYGYFPKKMTWDNSGKSYYRFYGFAYSSNAVIGTNLNGFYNVIKPIIMSMIQNRGGRVIALTSVSGLTGNRGQVNYSASKAGIIGAAKALSREVAKRKITVNCVAPGIIETDMTTEIPDEIIKELVPLKRAGSSKEVASLINYLMSEDAGYITGQVISVNGGMYI